MHKIKSRSKYIKEREEKRHEHNRRYSREKRQQKQTIMTKMKVLTKLLEAIHKNFSFLRIIK